MADAADSKSVGLKTVRVQVPPPARALEINVSKAFLMLGKARKNAPRRGVGATFGATC